MVLVEVTEVKKRRLVLVDLEFSKINEMVKFVESSTAHRPEQVTDELCKTVIETEMNKLRNLRKNER